MNEITSPIFAPSQLQEVLDSMKDQKFGKDTVFGITNIFPEPYSQFDNADNPKKGMKGFYNE